MCFSSYKIVLVQFDIIFKCFCISKQFKSQAVTSLNVLTFVHNVFQALHILRMWSAHANDKMMVDNANKCAIVSHPNRISPWWLLYLSFVCFEAMVNAPQSTNVMISNSIDEQLQWHKMFPDFYHPIWNPVTKWSPTLYMDPQILYDPFLFYARVCCRPTGIMNEQYISLARRYENI